MSQQVYLVRVAAIFALFTGMYLALGAFVYDLQINKHAELYRQARKIYTSSKREKGKRGRIYDRRGSLLVGNLNCQDVLAELRQIPRDRWEDVIHTAVAQFGVDPEKLRARFQSGAVEVVVARRVPIDQVRIFRKKLERPLPERRHSSKRELSFSAGWSRRIKGFFRISADKLPPQKKQKKHPRMKRLPGIRVVPTQVRWYPKGKLLANVLGFVDASGIGAYGLEKSWDTQLRPQSVKITYERDRKGRPLACAPFMDTQARNGRDLYLTIDEPIQTIVERELANLAATFKPHRAYAIMAEPTSGAILAMAQWPSYDPNNRQKMNPDYWRNHMLSDVYDPGSTMKCVSISGALDYGVVTLDSVFNCEGGHWFYAGRSLRDSGHQYGQLSVAQILQKSSNIGTAKIALKLGKERLYQVFRRFGFGETTGLGLGVESPGILRRPDRWDGLSITRFPIGQGISVTPIQMVQAYCALANQGRMMQLHLVDRVRDSITNQFSVQEPEEKRLCIRPKAAYDIITAMMMVTRPGGTARRAAIAGYEVAGKTGTSQKWVNGSYEGHHFVASFIGFVPARKPAFVLLVVADEPSTGKYYGGTVCAPTFQRIAEQTLRYLDISPVAIPEKEEKKK